MTKQTACAIGRSITMERHLWLNLTGIKEKDKVFLLDAPVSVQDSVHTVVSRFRKAKKQEEAFDKFLPCCAQGSELSATQPQTGPASQKREAQKKSIASRAPSHKDWCSFFKTQNILHSPIKTLRHKTVHHNTLCYCCGLRTLRHLTLCQN